MKRRSKNVGEEDKVLLIEFLFAKQFIVFYQVGELLFARVKAYFEVNMLPFQDRRKSLQWGKF